MIILPTAFKHFPTIAKKSFKSLNQHIAPIVIIIALALLCASSYLLIATIRNRALSKAQKFLASQDYVAAAEHFIKADKLAFRTNMEIERGLAESFVGTGNNDKALKHYERLVELDPSNIDDRYILGVLYIKTKDYKNVESQISALRNMEMEKATAYADELASQIQTQVVKGFIKDFVDKIIPGFKRLPFSREKEYDQDKDIF